jgi:hypothetical protein
MAMSKNGSAGTSGLAETAQQAKVRRIAERVEEMAKPDFPYP